MEKLSFDNGIREYGLGSGVLRYHPGDPNLYMRVREAADKFTALEQDLAAKAGAVAGEEAVRLLTDADRQMKELLGWIFGPGNDFDQLLDGVNLLAVGANGERVMTNLLQALEPLLVEGAQRCAAAMVGK